MKIKLAYPKIPDTLNCPLKQCIAFEKIDGTCMAFYWSPEDGIHSFGTRRDQFAFSCAGFSQFYKAHPNLDGIEGAIRRDLTKELVSRLTGEEVILFAEFHGPNSFAGSHQPKDEKRLTLFDAQVDGVMLPPEQFLTQFQGANLPQVVFRGKFTGQLFMDVRNGKYPVQEGVVVKGMVGGQVYMAKVKTNAYLERLKREFKDNWKEYWE